jgi:hypothetical protein
MVNSSEETVQPFWKGFKAIIAILMDVLLKWVSILNMFIVSIIKCMIEGDCERRIDEYRARVRSQQELIRSRRAEAETLKQEAVRCRAEADSCAIL